MPKNATGQARYADTLAYLTALHPNLAVHVDATIVGNKATIGDELSLTGYKSYAVFGNAQTGRAVRALMLCQRAYFGAHWSRMKAAVPGASIPLDWAPNQAQSRTITKDEYLSKSTAAVNRAILSFTVPMPAPQTSTLADAAELIGSGNPPGNLPPIQKMSRDNPFPPMGICYDGVYYWLYKAGFVSKRWLLSLGFTIDALNANAILGNGVPLALNANGTAPNIPRGMVVNFRGDQADTRNTCHWVVSLGNGNLIGVNNTSGGVVNGQQFNVRFRTGNSLFGTFPLIDMWTVYTGQITYSNAAGRSGCVVAMIDPSTIPLRDVGR